MLENITTTDFSQMSLDELAEGISREHGEAHALAETATQKALRVGQMLLEAKARLQHGEWLPWLAENVKLSQPQASRYMKLANNSCVNNLSNAASVNEALRIIGGTATSPKAKPKTLGSDEPSRKPVDQPTPKPVTQTEQHSVPSRDKIFESMKLMVDIVQESKATKAQKESIIQATQTTIDLIMARVDSNAEVVEKQQELDALIESRRQKEHEAEQRNKQLLDALSTVDRMMTYEEFKIIRGLLHPDRYPDELRERAGKAFDIFNRLEKAVNPHLGIAELRKRGWEHLSPYFKAKARKAK